jgi:hypothetical protein
MPYYNIRHAGGRPASPSFEARKRSHLRMTMLRRRPFGGKSPDCAALHPGYDAGAVPVRRRVRE